MIIKKAREFQKNIYFCFIDYAKALDCVYHNKLWKILKKMGIPDHLTCLLRNLYASQEVWIIMASAPAPAKAKALSRASSIPLSRMRDSILAQIMNSLVL